MQDRIVPRFYFHIRDGDRLLEDPAGSDLPDLQAARASAVVAIRDAVAEQIRTGRAVGGRSFEIADEAGRVLATVTDKDAATLH